MVSLSHMCMRVCGWLTVMCVLGVCVGVGVSLLVRYGDNAAQRYIPHDHIPLPLPLPLPPPLPCL